VCVFMNYLLKKLREDDPLLKVLDIFSDGAGSQFKQRYLFSNLYALEQDYSLSTVSSGTSSLPPMVRVSSMELGAH